MMDARLGFAVFVLAMCALDLLWSASVKLNLWWLHHVSPRKKSPAKKTGRAAERGDWYAFFHCADLVGQDPVQKQSVPDISDRPVTERKNHRPRINLS